MALRQEVLIENLNNFSNSLCLRLDMSCSFILPVDGKV